MWAGEVGVNVLPINVDVLAQRHGGFGAACQFQRSAISFQLQNSPNVAVVRRRDWC